MLAINLYGDDILRICAGIKEVVRAPRRSYHYMHRKMSVARHGWRKDLALVRLEILRDHASPRIEPLEFGVDRDLLRAGCRRARQTAHGYENAKYHCPMGMVTPVGELCPWVESESV